ncbi:hypothetical protein PGTUg99_030116 [Puccinia graminis f. sp. tritici]|uniref:Uncharacterized protein n=1 Tax=Puccinia graminis f. sp. tritici TaxID=56615 RepID=A0A5B0NKX9_PUCGR|nr:hypothetical protein PGTUg99_030116 [Puccinia graminis f. sp. tritici]
MVQRALSAPKIKTPGSPGIVKTLGFGTPKTLGPITKIVQVPHSAHAPRAPALPLLLPPPLGHIHPLDPKSHPRRAHHTRLTLHSSVITFSRLKHFILAWLERCGHLHPSLLGLNASSSLGASSLPGSNTADIQKSRSGE